MKVTIAGLLVLLAVANGRFRRPFLDDYNDVLAAYREEQEAELRTYSDEDEEDWLDNELQDRQQLELSTRDIFKHYHEKAGKPDNICKAGSGESKCSLRLVHFNVMDENNSIAGSVAVNRCKGECNSGYPCYGSKEKIKKIYLDDSSCISGFITEHSACDCCTKTRKSKKACKAVLEA